MTRTIRAELAKLATVRGPAWVMLAQIALLVAAASGAVVSGAVTAKTLADSSGLRMLLGHGGLVAIFSMVLGISITAGEYRHGSAVGTFLTEPRRVRVLGAKLLSALVIGTVIGLVVTATTLLVGLGWCAAKDVAFNWSVGWRSGLGVLVWNILFTVIGAALGTIIRLQAVAITGAIVWVFVAETALGQLVRRVGRWLPENAAIALGNSPQPGLLSQVTGGFILAGWTLLIAAAAVPAIARRDVA